MNPFPIISLLSLFTFHGYAQGNQPFPEEDLQGAELIEKAKLAVDAYHDGAQAFDSKIRLVYFHPADMPPLKNWEERLQRTVADISAFYRDGFDRLGLPKTGLPFEIDGDKLTFHVVKGSKNSSEYTHQSGRAIELEMRKALAGTVDFSREHVLVLHGLCREDSDGKFVFHAPYYGRGNQKNGLCHAADCRLLDPLLLKTSDRKIVYAEHYYARKEQPLYLFNTWYLGGTAHELGHGIALPHNSGTPEEKTWAATSLMGRGNLHYRSDTWGGKRPSFLSRSCALRLISSPLLTRSNKGRWDKTDSNLKDIKTVLDQKELVITGEVETQIPAYAVIVYIWPYQSYPDKPGTDHGAVTLPSLISDGKFACGGLRLSKKHYLGKISSIHVNGASVNHPFQLTISDGQPVIDFTRKK